MKLLKSGITAILIANLLILSACGGATNVKVARSFAIAPVALDAASQILEVLAAGNDISEADAQGGYKAIDAALTALNDTRGDVASGNYDQAKIDARIQLALSKVQALAQTGKFGIKNPASQQRLAAFTALASISVQQVSNFIRAAKVVSPDTRAAMKDKGAENRAQAELSASSLSQIIVISGTAGTNVAILVSTSDVQTLWQNAGDSITAALENNRSRIK